MSTFGLTLSDLCHSRGLTAVDLACDSYDADDIACCGHSAVSAAWNAVRLCLREGCRCGVDLVAFEKLSAALNKLESEEG